MAEWDWRSSPPNAVFRGTWPWDSRQETVQVFHHHGLPEGREL